MRSYLDRGYSTVKMKVGLVPLEEDLERIEAVLEVLGGDGSKLCVDVNGRFSLEEAIRFGHAIAGFGLRWYEELLDLLDYLAHAALATSYAPALATGENLLHAGRAQPDPARGIAPRSRHPAVRSGPFLRPRRVPSDPRHAPRPRMVALPLRRMGAISSRSTSPSDSGSEATRATSTYSPFGGFRSGPAGQPGRDAGCSRDRLKANRRSMRS